MSYFDEKPSPYFFTKMTFSDFELDYINFCDFLEKSLRCLDLDVENDYCPPKVLRGPEGTSCIPPQNLTNATCPDTIPVNTTKPPNYYHFVDHLNIQRDFDSDDKLLQDFTKNMIDFKVQKIVFPLVCIMFSAPAVYLLKRYFKQTQRVIVLMNLLLSSVLYCISFLVMEPIYDKINNLVDPDLIYRKDTESLFIIELSVLPKISL
jgi:hypothetical protein